MTNKLVAYSYGTAAPVELADGVGECNVDNYYIFVDSDHKGLTVGECNIDKYYIFVDSDQEGLIVGVVTLMRTTSLLTETWKV